MSLRQIAVLIVLHRSFRGGGEAKRRGLAWREAREVEAVTGKGLRAELGGQKVIIGNARLFESEVIPSRFNS